MAGEKKRRWEYLWWAKGVGEGAKTPRELAKALRDSADELEALSSAGENVSFMVPVENGCGRLVVEDEKIAERFELSRLDEDDEEV